MKRPLFLLLIILTFPLWAQQTAVNDEKLSYVGMTLAQLFENFGVPKTVLAARGNEYWQDDVVFQYNEGDFFLHRDRVWQVMLTSACGIANRDRKAVVLLTLGNAAQDMGDHILLPVSGKDWPLMLRVNISSSGQVSAIYIYRPDY
jgi:lipopolysaccharide export system protein LptC